MMLITDTIMIINPPDHPFQKFQRQNIKTRLTINYHQKFKIPTPRDIPIAHFFAADQQKVRDLTLVLFGVRVVREAYNLPGNFNVGRLKVGVF
jgi:hypothetical protein